MEPDDLTDEDNAVIHPLEGVLDLHTFAPRDIPSLVEEYLHECLLRGITEVRIIHGKGTGFQREMVRKVLDRLPFVAGHRTAPPEAGGWGATIAVLRTGPPERS